MERKQKMAYGMNNDCSIRVLNCSSRAALTSLNLDEDFRPLPSSVDSLFVPVVPTVGRRAFPVAGASSCMKRFTFTH